MFSDKTGTYLIYFLTNYITFKTITNNLIFNENKNLNRCLDVCFI